MKWVLSSHNFMYNYEFHNVSASERKAGKYSTLACIVHEERTCNNLTILKGKLP